MDWELITRLLSCFPNSFINHNKKLQGMGEEQFGFSEIPVKSVSLQNLTVGEFMGILRHNI